MPVAASRAFVKFFMIGGSEKHRVEAIVRTTCARDCRGRVLVIGA